MAGDDGSADGEEGRRRLSLRRMLQAGGDGAAAEGVEAPSDPLEEKLLGLLDTIEAIGDSLVNAEASVLGVLSEAAAIGTSGSSDSQGVTNGFMALVDEASAFQSATRNTAVQVLEATEAALERAKTLNNGLATLAADMDDAISQNKALLSGTLFHVELALGVSFGFATAAEEEVAACHMEGTGGSLRIGFSISSAEVDGGAKAVRQRGRSLLIGGGTSSRTSTLATGTGTAGMSVGKDGSYEAALQATANALQGDSWSTIKQHTSDKAIGRLPAPKGSTAPLPGMTEGVLLHLQRKVRQLGAASSIRFRPQPFTNRKDGDSEIRCRWWH